MVYLKDSLFKAAVSLKPPPPPTLEDDDEITSQKTPNVVKNPKGTDGPGGRGGNIVGTNKGRKVYASEGSGNRNVAFPTTNVPKPRTTQAAFKIKGVKPLAPPKPFKTAAIPPPKPPQPFESLKASMRHYLDLEKGWGPTIDLPGKEFTAGAKEGGRQPRGSNPSLSLKPTPQELARKEAQVTATPEVKTETIKDKGPVAKPIAVKQGPTSTPDEAPTAAPEAEQPPPATPPASAEQTSAQAPAEQTSAPAAPPVQKIVETPTAPGQEVKTVNRPCSQGTTGGTYVTKTPTANGCAYIYNHPEKMSLRDSMTGNVLHEWDHKDIQNNQLVIPPNIAEQHGVDKEAATLTLRQNWKEHQQTNVKSSEFGEKHFDKDHTEAVNQWKSAIAKFKSNPHHYHGVGHEYVSKRVGPHGVSQLEEHHGSKSEGLDALLAGHAEKQARVKKDGNLGPAYEQIRSGQGSVTIGGSHSEFHPGAINHILAHPHDHSFDVSKTPEGHMTVSLHGYRDHGDKQWHGRLNSHEAISRIGGHEAAAEHLSKYNDAHQAFFNEIKGRQEPVEITNEKVVKHIVNNGDKFHFEFIPHETDKGQVKGVRLLGVKHPHDSDEAGEGEWAGTKPPKGERTFLPAKITEPIKAPETGIGEGAPPSAVPGAPTKKTPTPPDLGGIEKLPPDLKEVFRPLPPQSTDRQKFEKLKQWASEMMKPQHRHASGGLFNVGAALASKDIATAVRGLYNTAAQGIPTVANNIHGSLERGERRAALEAEHKVSEKDKHKTNQYLSGENFGHSDVPKTVGTTSHWSPKQHTQFHADYEALSNAYKERH